MYTIKHNFNEFLNTIPSADRNIHSVSFWLYFGDYLDELRRLAAEEFLNCFKIEPAYTDFDTVSISFLTASVEHLHSLRGLRAPVWVFNQKFVLKEPYFSMNAKGMLRVCLLCESPTAFRSRLLFVNDNVLMRV